MKLKNKLLLSAMLSAVAATSAYADSKPASKDKKFTLIHIGDIHGHLAPRPNLRSTADYPGQMVGGLARMAKEIKNIKESHEHDNGGNDDDNTLVINTGDTIQGSGEALYTRGQALVDVVDMLRVDAFAPGNWDYVYGPARFKELFATTLADGTVKSKRWGAIASNLYNTDPAHPGPNEMGSAQDSNVSQAEYDAYSTWYSDNGQRVLPPYQFRTINGVKIGILGCTTSRGPQVVGKWVTTGLEFTDCSKEVPKFATELRAKGAQVVVLVSEIEIGRNIQLMKSLTAGQHIDVVLNADMHEETLKPIEVTDQAGNKTWIIEEGQDGTMISELNFNVDTAGNVTIAHLPHRIDDRIKEDKKVAQKVAEVSYPFNAGFTPNTHANPFTGTYLKGPLSEVVGTTEVGLHRSNYSNEEMPAVIEGSSHDFIADAMRWWAKSDMATVRGFRYGTHVTPGPITRNDLFHFVPIGPRVGKVSRITLNQLRNQVDNSSMAVFSSNPGAAVTPRPAYNNPLFAGYDGVNTLASPGAALPGSGLSGNALGFGGGWLFAYSADGFHMDFDPYFVPSWQTIRKNADGSDASATAASASGIYLGNATQVTKPAGDTSRARNLTVNMPCKLLPPAEQVTAPRGDASGCFDKDARFATVMTNGTDGKYTANWVTNYGTGVNNVLGAAAKDTYLLNPDGWQFLMGTPNNPLGAKAVKAPFQAPTFTAAGYWYAQSPNTLNNCNNCYPTGYSTTVGDPDAAYVLPVNVGNDGNAALDAAGNPKYVRDTAGAVIMDANGKPMIEGSPIDLTEIIEKYLASLGTPVSDANLPKNRISLQKALPISSTGFPTMQPLCGTIGQDPLVPNVCPE